MVITRTSGGKIVIAYESVEEMLELKSCQACAAYYKYINGCPYYAACKAGKRVYQEPAMFDPLVPNALAEILKEIGGS